MPIFVEDRLLAALTMRFASTAVTEKEAVTRFVPQLRKTAQDIADEFIRQHQREPIDGNLDIDSEL